MASFVITSEGSGNDTTDDIEVWKAAAYGDVEALAKKLPESPNLAIDPDDQGFRPLQWAALNNRVAAVVWLLEHGANVHAEDPHGQTALHWCAVRGCVAAAEVLLRAGALPRHSDTKGFTVCHVAAQYGHSSLLYHLKVVWDTPMDDLDEDGRTPLHWAAYKGFSSTTVVLLLFQAPALSQDHEGFSALHWACMKGNQSVASILLKHGGRPMLNLFNTTGGSAKDLARERSHVLLEEFLSRYEKALGPVDSDRSTLGSLIHSMQLWLSVAVWGIIVLMVALFIRLVVVPPSLVDLPSQAVPSTSLAVAAWAAVVLASAGLGALLQATSKDPGYVKKDCWTAALSQPALWSGHWDQVCTRCRIVPPARCFHCQACDRCVLNLDHHAPWLGCCVGQGNRREVFLFLCLETVAAAIGALAAYQRLSSTGPEGHVWVHAPGVAAWLLVDSLILFFLICLLMLKLLEAGRNVTTFELANRFTVSQYLTAADGSMKLPFDKGCFENMKNFMSPSSTIVKPPTLEGFP